MADSIIRAREIFPAPQMMISPFSLHASLINHASNGDKMLVEGVDDYVDAELEEIKQYFYGTFAI